VAVEGGLGQSIQRAAQVDALAVTEIPRGHNARQALERFRHVLVGKFANVLRGEDILNAGSFALGLQRRFNGGAIALDNDFLEIGRSCVARARGARRGIRGGVCRDGRRRIGLHYPVASEQGHRHSRTDQRRPYNSHELPPFMLSLAKALPRPVPSPCEPDPAFLRCCAQLSHAGTS